MSSWPKRSGSAPSPCLRRVRALEENGVIRRYVTLVDPGAVGLPVSVFVNVSLERQVENALKKFESAVLTRPEVMECYLMTGDADYLLRVVCADLAAYERFLMEHLTQVAGVVVDPLVLRAQAGEILDSPAAWSANAKAFWSARHPCRSSRHGDSARGD